MLKRLVSRYWLLIPILILIVVVLDRVEQPDLIETEETINMSETRSDYYMSDFRTRKFDQDGQLEYIIQGATLAHYPDGDRSEIVAPNVELRREQTTWIVKGQRGRFESPQTLFTLEGDVTVLRSNTNADTQPITIKTESISIATESNLVHTDQPIEIVAPQWSLSATGLRSAIDQGTLSLLSNVVGRYQLPTAKSQD